MKKKKTEPAKKHIQAYRIALEAFCERGEKPADD